MSGTLQLARSRSHIEQALTLCTLSYGCRTILGNSRCASNVAHAVGDELLGFTQLTLFILVFSELLSRTKKSRLCTAHHTRTFTMCNYAVAPHIVHSPIAQECIRTFATAWAVAVPRLLRLATPMGNFAVAPHIEHRPPFHGCIRAPVTVWAYVAPRSLHTLNSVDCSLSTVTVQAFTVPWLLRSAATVRNLTVAPHIEHTPLAHECICSLLAVVT